MNFDINSKIFWTGVGSIIGYTIGQRTWPYHNRNGEEISKVFVCCMRGAFSGLAAVEFRNRAADNVPVTFNEVAFGVSAIALTYLTTQYLYPPNNTFI